MNENDAALFLKKIPVRLRAVSGSFRITLRRLIHRCPRRFRWLGAPLLGGLAGLVGGIPGFLIGFLLGYLLKELFSQTTAEKKILDYFENPGAQRFYEGEPGLAAWCALAVLIVSERFSAEETPAGGPSPALSDEEITTEVLLKASLVFTGPFAEPYLTEHFIRLALSRRDSLNSDLLAESLAARRASLGAFADSGYLGRSLVSLAGGEKSRRLAYEIRLILDPAFANGENSENSAFKDPWKILGLTPGTDPKEVKAHFRRLAKQFHPDELQILNENQREAAARAFMAIKEAYRQISEGESAAPRSPARRRRSQAESH